MTESALAWRAFDARLAPTTCDYAGCQGAPVAMRGPRHALLRLAWRSYCSTHASLYGVNPRWLRGRRFADG